MISDNQAGFRKGYRTTDQIYILKTLLNKYLHKKNKPLFACFVDFSKAFDMVWRDALLFKMNDVGISGNVYNIIQNMYSNTFICIQKNNLVSDPIQTHIGVKQGDSLSSTLFNLYLHDFDKCFSNCNNVEPVSLLQHDFNHLLFADDLLLLSESNTGLQNCLNSLSDYCSKWKIQINLDKTKIIIFSKGKRDFKKFRFALGNSEIEIVEKYKYLGIIFTYNGNMKHSSDDLYKKGLKAFFKLKSKFMNFENIPIKTSLKLFDTLIRPIITYGCEVWFTDYKFSLDNCDKLNTEKLQHKMLKSILGVKRQASNMACRLECNREPITIFVLSQMYKYYQRLSKLNENRILYSAYLTDCELYTDKVKSGISNIHKAYEYINREFDQFKMDHTTFNKLIKEKFNSNEIKKVNQIKQGEMDSKLDFYCNIYDPENNLPSYLSLPIPRTDRCQITKLRISDHNLKIERGRYTRPKTAREFRLCPNCNEVETETHFLIKCPKYDNERQKMLNIYDINISTWNNEIEKIMNPSNTETCYGLINYIKNAFNIRETI